MDTLDRSGKRGTHRNRPPFLDAGADVSIGDTVGWTALMWAANHGRTSTVEALLAAGSDVDARNDLGQTALMLGEDHTEVVRLLTDAEAGETVKPRLRRNR